MSELKTPQGWEAGRDDAVKVVRELIARAHSQVEFFAKRGDRQEWVEAFARDEQTLTDALDGILAMEPPA